MQRARNCFYLFIIICFLVVPLPCQIWAEEGSNKAYQQEQSSTQNQPHISFDATSYDAGDVWEGDKVSHTFTVKNTGTAQLDIREVKTG